jgi:hypothetical protein
VSWTLAALVAVLAVAALSGCGSGSAGNRISSAAMKSEHAGGVHLATSVTVSFPNGGQGVIDGNGSFDSERGVLRVDMSNLLQNSQLPIGSGRGVEARYLTERGDPVLYLRMPFLDSQLPPGKRWVRLDLQRTGNAMGVNFNQLLGEAGQSPTQLLDLLQASEQVKKVGPDIVAGAKVTQYHGLIDLRKALALRGVSDAAIDRVLAEGQPPTIPVDVWIGDGDGLVHQMRTMSSTQIGGQTVKTATLTTLSRWGMRVAVVPPPPSEVYDASGPTSGVGAA